MTTSVSITSGVQGNNLVVEAHLVTPADIPLDVFLYENTGTATLGAYMGVANLQDYQRIQVWTGAEIPVFGNKFVKHTQAHIILPLTVSAASVTSILKAGLTQFRTEYLALGSVTVVSVI